MFRFILLISILVSSLSAQYSKNDYELAKTTFAKTFEKEIIGNYLNSGNSNKVIAGLQSVTQANDTSFIPLITKLDKDNYGKYTAFAIGHLPFSYASIEYLRERIFIDTPDQFMSDYLEAYGKIGTKDDYKLLIDFLSISENHFQGFSNAVYNFHQRGIIDDYQQAAKILLQDINSDNEQILFDALFGIARTDAGKYAMDEVVDLIIRKYQSLSTRCLTYAISVLRRAESFPLSFEIIHHLLKHNDWHIRTEISRALVSYKHIKSAELDTWLGLLKDKNVNVARQTAISLKQVDVIEDLKDYIKSSIENFLTEDLNEEVKGELFISYCALFPEILKNNIQANETTLKLKYIARALQNNIESPEYNLSIIKSKFNSATIPERMELVTALIALQGKMNNNEEFYKLLLSELDSDESTIISLISFELDSSFVEINKTKIREIIAAQVDRHLNTPTFNEGLTSLYNLAKTIDKDFAKEILGKFQKSQCDDLVRFYQSEKGEKNIRRSDTMFDKLWGNAFKYEFAVVNTTAGHLTLRLLPELAPITVGNFNCLSESNYFNNVIFHRVVPNFVAQVGDPTGTGWAGPGYTINSEFTPTPIAERFVGMASAGPDTEGSQWYILHNDFPHLYGRYTMFAEVIEGMDVVDMLDQNSRIESIELK